MNVTPLVDVVLVLLIIFMVVIPAIEQGLAIEIPGIHHPDTKRDSVGPALTLSISKQGGLFLDHQEIPWERLESRLWMAAQHAPRKRIILRGDKGTDYQHIRRAYRAAQQVGFPGVAMKVNCRQNKDHTTDKP